mmetsp:Transcript_115080/g.245862  ORF Transcript_115080/g.245862 Transcript_115080/m.245862 type:complete len:882 (+) Transcript_115080:55-2700(+)
MAESKAEGRVLLPDAVEPLRYEIRLEPDLERFVFDGSEEITVDVQEATDEISLHAKELKIDHQSVVFKPKDGEEVTIKEVRYELKENAVTFKFEEVLPVGEGVLEIKFVGVLNDQMAGFYRSGYTDITGKKKIMASTQFESLDARRAFPCWDEPARKAVFAVTLVVNVDLTAISNMPECSRKFLEGATKQEIVFMDSPKMSSYLLAFVVGEFDFLQAQTQHGVSVRVFTPPGHSSEGEFALNVACKSLDGYDDYFGIPYPLPKLDMVAIPEFAAGAMENWGLVTYREVDLLIGKSASAQQRQRVCIVVTHELAHQWFGNLVTMKWWDDLWLNEGFASWCENMMADHIFPSYSIWDQFTSDTQMAALKLDALRSSHPIQVPIKHAHEVEEVFDAISYCKGASVIRMAHAFLGASDFQKGLRDYFARHKYGNTETLDLWAAWGGASGKPVTELMASWTEQMGFPLLKVTGFEMGADSATLTLEQCWFLADGSEVKPEEEKTWKIPIICISGAGTTDMVLMSDKAMKITIAVKSADDFVKVNAGQHVPMRVLYTAEMQCRLATAVEKGLLPATDRAGLVLDSFALAKAGQLGADAVVKLLASFHGETNFVVWDAIDVTIRGLDRVLMSGTSDAIYAKFVSFVAGLIKNIASAIGWEGRDTDGHLDGLLRQTMVAMQAKFSSDEALVADARRRFDAYVVGDASVLPDDIKVSAFKVVVKSGGAKEYDALRKVYANATTNVEKLHVFQSIGHSPEASKKKEVLEWAISGEIKIQDFFYLIGSVAASSKAAVPMCWSFYQENFTKIKAMLKAANPSLMDSVIQLSTSGFCSSAAADEIEDFFKKNPMPDNKRKLSQILEEMRANAAFLDKILKTPLNEEKFWDALTA